MTKKTGDYSSGGKGYSSYGKSDGSQSVYRNDWLGPTYVGTAPAGTSATNVVRDDSGSDTVRRK